MGNIENYQELNNHQEEISEAYKEVSDFFGSEIENFNVVIANNREEFDQHYGKKTEDWVVGHALSKNEVLLLNPECWHTEAPSHNPEEFPKLIRHEITHLFTRQLARKSSKVPRWLNEGISCYVSKQFFPYDHPKYRLGFLEEISDREGWGINVKKGAYPISSAFVTFLVNRFGFEKIKELVINLPEKYSYRSFLVTFEKIIQTPLEELEKEFIANS